MPKGGRRRGAGRPKGSKTKRTQRKMEIAVAAAAGGILPLDFMLGIINNDDLDPQLRLSASQYAAPYIYPRIASVAKENEMKVIEHHQPMFVIVSVPTDRYVVSDEARRLHGMPQPEPIDLASATVLSFDDAPAGGDDTDDSDPAA